jgi:hypothetical protein
LTSTTHWECSTNLAAERRKVQRVWYSADAVWMACACGTGFTCARRGTEHVCMTCHCLMRNTCAAAHWPLQSAEPCTSACPAKQEIMTDHH